MTRSLAARGFGPVASSPGLGGPADASTPIQTKVDIDGNTFDVAFRFADRGLAAVLLSTLADSPDRAGALHDGLLRSLTARYGAPWGAESRGTTSLTRWIFKTTTIALRRDAIEVERRPLGQISILYTPTMQSDRREPDEGMLFLLLLQMLGKGRR